MNATITHILSNNTIVNSENNNTNNSGLVNNNSSAELPSLKEVWRWVKMIV